MRNVAASVIMSLALLLFAMAGVATAGDEDVTSPASDPWQVRSIATPVKSTIPSYIAADGDFIAWTGASPTGSKMYLFNTITGKNIALPTPSDSLPGSYYNPSIEGSYVVFQGARAGGYDDIYFYDMSEGVVRQLTNNTKPGDWYDWNPRLDGARLVWEKDMSGADAKPGIYMHDIASGVKTLLLQGDDYRNPDLWGEYLVCVKNVKSGQGAGPASEIILYNLTTKEKRSIADSTRSNEHPRIDDGRVVWTSGQVWTAGAPDPWLTYQIHVYDIATGTDTTLTNNVAGNLAPDIDGDLVTWETKQPSAIKAYDLGTDTEILIPMQADAAHAPDASPAGIVWFGSKGLYVAVSPENATTFPDVPRSHPYYEAIEQMAAKKIISGYTTGSFGPEDLVMRQQFAKMIVLTKGIQPTFADEYHFTDADDIEDKEGELYPYHFIARAAISGLVKGYTDGSFRPFTNISRKQVVTMVVRAGSSVLAPPPNGYQGVLDYTDPEHGANIRVAEYNGLLDGIVGSSAGLAGWKTDDKATRGECAQILWRLFTKLQPQG
jgi:hypothetical protein